MIKLILPPLFLFLLAACSNSDSVHDGLNFNIVNAFGFEIGSTPNNLPDGYLTETQTFETSTPPKPDPQLLNYTYNVTPKSHLIYGVTAVSGYKFSREECETLEQLYMKRYEDQFGKKPYIKHSNIAGKWILREHNSRSITVHCSFGVNSDSQPDTAESYRLEVIFFDKELSLLGYKEWQDHQEDTRTSVRG